MKLKQNSFVSVLFQFHFSFISIVLRFLGGEGAVDFELGTNLREFFSVFMLIAQLK